LQVTTLAILQKDESWVKRQQIAAARRPRRKLAALPGRKPI
jgi:hypothetical protein